MIKAALLTGVVLSALGQPAAAADKVKIGFVNSFSGPNATLGNDQRDAAELALDHIGGKMGGVPVEIIYEDDQQKPEIGKQVTEKLIQSGKVDFLTGYIWSNVLLASLKPAVDSETFIISANAGPSQIAGELCSPWFFSVSYQNDQTDMAMGEILNKKGLKKLFIMAPNYSAGKDNALGLKRTFNGEVVGEEYTRWPGQLDFSAELSKIRSVNPDGIWIFYPGAAGVQFFLQYAQSGLKDKIPLYSTYVLDTHSLPQIKELALGSLSTQSWVNDLDNAVNKKFVADFRARFGRYPSFFSAQSYDSIMLIKSAVDTVTGDLTRKEDMRRAMEKANFPNTRGKIRFGNNHFPIQNFYLQEVVKDEKDEFTLKTVDVAYKDHQDIYAEKCPMK